MNVESMSMAEIRSEMDQLRKDDIRLLCERIEHRRAIERIEAELQRIQVRDSQLAQQRHRLMNGKAVPS